MNQLWRQISCFSTAFVTVFNPLRGPSVDFSRMHVRSKFHDFSRYFVLVFIRCEGRVCTFWHPFPSRNFLLFDGCSSIARADRVFKRSFQQLVYQKANIFRSVLSTKYQNGLAFDQYQMPNTNIPKSNIFGSVLGTKYQLPKPFGIWISAN